MPASSDIIGRANGGAWDILVYLIKRIEEED